MDLTKEELGMLKGEQGDAVAYAMKRVVNTFSYNLLSH